MGKKGPKKEQINNQKTCILEVNKICDNCCECFICELDPNKICDNCAKCLGLNEVYEDNNYNFFILEDEDDTN